MAGAAFFAEVRFGGAAPAVRAHPSVGAGAGRLVVLAALADWRPARAVALAGRGAAVEAFDRALVVAAFFASLTDRRLRGPRTGDRSMNTHPTWGTGLPPMSRPWSNSQPY